MVDPRTFSAMSTPKFVQGGATPRHTGGPLGGIQVSDGVGFSTFCWAGLRRPSTSEGRRNDGALDRGMSSATGQDREHGRGKGQQRLVSSALCERGLSKSRRVPLDAISRTFSLSSSWAGSSVGATTAQPPLSSAGGLWSCSAEITCPRWTLGPRKLAEDEGDPHACDWKSAG